MHEVDLNSHTVTHADSLQYIEHYWEKAKVASLVLYPLYAGYPYMMKHQLGEIKDVYTMYSCKSILEVLSYVFAQSCSVKTLLWYILNIANI